MVPDREHIDVLLDLLGSPQRAYPVLHVGGTNGKTSTTRMIDSVLRAFGLRVGRYTSPHLETVRERIGLDGEPLSEEAFVRAYDEVAPLAELVDKRGPDPVTYFEMLTAMAFAAFADTPVDVAVVEVGLGGTWDATNTVDAATAVITPVSLDHTDLLGTSLAGIAAEKAGIIAPGATLVLALQPLEAAEQLLRRAAEVGATVAREGLEFGVIERAVAVGGQVLQLQGLGGRYDELFLPLHGAHQAGNAACAVAAVEAFLGGGRSGPIDVVAIREGLADVRSPGRLEVLRTSPTVLIDAGHNPAGVAASVAGVQEAFGFRRLVGVLAVLADKDVPGMLEILEPALDAVVVTQNSSPRSLSADDLAALAVEYFGADRVEVELRLDGAIEAAVRLAEDDDDGPMGGGGVLVTGSVVTAGEARVLLGRPG